MAQAVPVQVRFSACKSFLLEALFFALPLFYHLLVFLYYFFFLFANPYVS